MFLYKFVRHDPELGYLVEVFDPAKVDILAAAEVRNVRYLQPCNRPGIRDELVGHPVFYELNGPMYDGMKDGAHVIRYEGSV